MIGAFATTLLNVTDTAFLGRVGETELGASAIGGVFYFAFAMIGVALGIGAQILIARRSGEQNESEVGNIFDHSFILLTLLGFLLFLILFFFSDLILRNSVESAEIAEATVSFIKYRSWGIVFLMMATAFRSFYVGVATPNVYGVYAFIMAGVNIILGYAFIFGYGSIPAMGIEGAGLAASISELVSLLFLFTHVFLKKSIKKFRLFRFDSFQKDTFLKILNLSAPLVVQNMLSMGAWLVFFLFIEKLGSRDLAVSNVVRAVYMLGMTPMWGFSVSANSMVSNIIGQGRSDEVKVLLMRIIRLTLLTSLLMVSINLIFPHQVLSIFTSDESLISDSFSTLMVVNVSMFFFSFAIVCISAVSGTGATRKALYIEIAAIIIYLIYIYSVTFSVTGPVEVVWMSEVIYWGFTGIVSYYYIARGNWKKIRI
mgnify:CR=1 FL=1